ncbi:MAG: PilN domain-containing protein [Balneolaceae bacterium]|nr:PilN domain-containing protein [Balneolaceae bacterium]MBO6546178.1 PilN domain-containing protein [Balneolaceae bacterium]MBO6648536.1 PilN domain-containing protein [Balneolaceae bacterium]
MLKIPFIEHTGIGLEITDEVIRWVEINRFGQRLSLKSSGEIVHNNSDASFLGAIEKFKEQIESDAYHLGITVPEALLDVYVEEVPYSEEESETGQWITQKEKELLEGHKGEGQLILHHLVQLDEDNKRCIFQIVDGDLIGRYKTLLSEMDLFPLYVGTGLLESGYSQIYNPDFLKEISSVVQYLNKNGYLTVFEKGLVKNVYEIGSASKTDTDFILNEAHSYLQTEEASTDLALNSISIQFAVYEADINPENGTLKRQLQKAIPFKGKKGLEETPGEYLLSIGTIVRLFFPGLDAFNYAEPSEIDTGILVHDKKETMRLGVMLFAPLIIFALFTYALNKIVDYRLVESNQVMEQIGDKIEEVTEKRELLVETRDRFVEARSVLEAKEPIAFIFEQIGTHIPEDMWLMNLSVANPSEAQYQQVRVSGYSGNENSISLFLNRLEESDGVQQASLILSEKVEASSNRSPLSAGLIGATRFELLIRFSNP